MTEQWRSLDFLGFSKYSVSDQGRVRNNNTGRILKNQPITSKHSATKYRFVSLSRDDSAKFTCKSVHRLVLAAFAGESDLPVSHLDGNKANNAASNLCYETLRENCRRDHRAGRIKARHIVPDLVVVLIRQLWDNGLNGKEIAAAIAGLTEQPVSLRHIWNIASRRRRVDIPELCLAQAA